MATPFELEMAGYVAGKSVKETAAALTDLVVGARVQHVKRTGDPYINTAGKLAAMREIDAVYQGKLTVLLGRVQEAERTAPQRPATYTPPDAAAFEAGAYRVWQRLAAQLGAGIDVAELVKTLDRPQLRVLEEEYPAWARTKLGTGPAAEQAVKALEEVLVRRLQELWTPEEQRAYARHLEWQRGLVFAQTAINYCAGGYWTAATVLPTWDGKTIQVPTPDGWYEPDLARMAALQGLGIKPL
jgi:hypothetical protein